MYILEVDEGAAEAETRPTRWRTKIEWLLYLDSETFPSPAHLSDYDG